MCSYDLYFALWVALTSVFPDDFSYCLSYLYIYFHGDITSCPNVKLRSLFTVPVCRRLDANHISGVPIGCFSGLRSLRHLWLDDNSLTEVPVEALNELPALQAMTLALNHISHVPDHAFSKLGRLVVLYVQHGHTDGG